MCVCVLNKGGKIFESQKTNPKFWKPENPKFLESQENQPEIFENPKPEKIIFENPKPEKIIFENPEP